jgi:catechol 2,3-dioxygenase-like lactoylglutathione lyase family enzyme
MKRRFSSLKASAVTVVVIVADDLTCRLGAPQRFGDENVGAQPARFASAESSRGFRDTGHLDRIGRSFMATVSVRYIVDDVDAAIDFYCNHLGFSEVMHPAPTFAMLSRGDLRLVLTAPGGGPGGGQAMPDGTVPEPGGWNRFLLEVPDLEATVERLRDHGARFRNEIVEGVGGKQILVEDPAGNPVELFEPVLDEAKLSPEGS